jgi:cytochrome P450
MNEPNEPASGLPTYPMPRTALHYSPELARLQEEDPITKVQLWNRLEPWLFTRYDDVCAILRDPRVSADSSRPTYPHTSAAVAETRSQFPTFLQMDPPQHQFYRRMLAADFTPKAVAKLRVQIEQIVEGALEELCKHTPPVDFVEEFALVVPSTVIAGLLGVPYTDHAFFQSRSKTLVSSHTTQQEARVAAEELRVYLTDLIAAKNRDPGDDVLSRLVVNHMRNGELTPEEVVATARLLLTGGHDTTANLIALGTLALLLHPDQLDLLRHDRTLLPNAIEEMLRFFTITHIGRRRVASEEIEISGVVVAAGDGIVAAHEMANRDPCRFENPNSFDIRRKTLGHLGFGCGPHQCLGQSLARLELEIVFERLFDRIPNLRLGADVHEMKFKSDSIAYGVEQMLVTW